MENCNLRTCYITQDTISSIDDTSFEGVSSDMRIYTDAEEDELDWYDCYEYWNAYYKDWKDAKFLEVTYDTSLEDYQREFYIH